MARVGTQCGECSKMRIPNPLRRRKQTHIATTPQPWPGDAKWESPSVNRHYMTRDEMITVLKWWEKGEWGRAQLQSCFVKYPSTPPGPHIPLEQRVDAAGLVYPPCCPQGTPDALKLWAVILKRMHGQIQARVSTSPPGYMVVWKKQRFFVETHGPVPFNMGVWGLALIIARTEGDAWIKRFNHTNVGSAQK